MILYKKIYIVYIQRLFYITGATETQSESLDAMVPDTKEEFEQFGTALSQKINLFNKHAEFPQFAEDLIKYIALNCKYTHFH